MVEWLSEVMTSSHLSLAAFPVAFLVGLLGAFTSCCNLPVLGAIAGYSGALGDGTDRRAFLLIALLFIVGTVAALTALGALGGFLGHVAGASLGLYWRLFAGFIMVLFGLVSLGLAPFDFASAGAMNNLGSKTRFGPMIYGLAVGGGSAACSVCCNPALPAAVGIAAIQGQALWGAGLLMAFSVGYSLPMAGVLVGLGFGFSRLKSSARRIGPAINKAAGCLLVGVGFYLLATA